VHDWVALVDGYVDSDSKAEAMPTNMLRHIAEFLKKVYICSKYYL
jgi:hypothetical protein